MNCPKCKGESKVFDSRATAQGVRRRRECLKCSERFSTIEIHTAPLKKIPAIKPVAAAKPKEEKKIPPKAKKVEGKTRPIHDWPKYENIPNEVHDAIFNHTGTAFSFPDE